jgi:hypothetical protein
MLRKWLAIAASTTLVAALPACDDSAASSRTSRQLSSAKVVSGGNATAATPAPGSGQTGQPSGQSDTTTLAADDNATIPVTDESADRDALIASLEADPEVLAIIGADPLINDGGAVFLEDSTSASGYRTQALATPTPQPVRTEPPDKGQIVNQREADFRPPRWKRLETKPVGGKWDNALRCQIPEALRADSPAGHRSLCFDKSAGLADVTLAQHVKGHFVLDAFPYLLQPIAAVLRGQPLQSIGLKTMDLVAVTNTRFRKTRTRWQLEGVSTTQLHLVNAASQSVRIVWTDLVSDGKTLINAEDPKALVPKRNLKPVPRSKQVLLRAKVSGDVHAQVFAESEGAGILRLLDNGFAPDETKGDGIYTARVPTPPSQRLVHRLSVTAFAAHTLSNEEKDDYDADTWIVPMRVD